MSIQKEFIVRYRAEGHVRFEIPELLCDEVLAKLISARVLEIEGVYKVDLFRKQKKLSIRYQEVFCEFEQLAKQLFQLISELDQQGLLVAKVVNEVNSHQRKIWNLKPTIKNWKASRWATEKYSDAKETVQAAKVITKLGLKKPNALIKDPEKAIIDFFNDVLVLYLIRLHWTRITQEWIPKPWTFRYQWTAVFYLFYLLMRSRKPK
ncbi:MAG: hypothetical protein L3J75_13355 [Methylococcaceae bacterium]|nr:hypothetical protein [Methylococcaceae bacterium]